MVDALYTRLHETSIRLIAKYGKIATIRRKVASGTPQSPTLTPTDYTCKLVETSNSIRNRTSTIVQTGDIFGIISPDVAVTVEFADDLVIDGKTYHFVQPDGLAPLNPGGLLMLYEFQARR